jgi:hypothetical protein
MGETIPSHLRALSAATQAPAAKVAASSISGCARHGEYEDTARLVFR